MSDHTCCRESLTPRAVALDGAIRLLGIFKIGTTHDGGCGSKKAVDKSLVITENVSDHARGSYTRIRPCKHLISRNFSREVVHRADDSDALVGT